MPIVNASTATLKQSNVSVFKPSLSKVLPPADWVLEGEFGHMAFEAGDAGRLARLADVLRWLQSSRALPRSEALKLLCDGLNAEVMGWLYWLQAISWALPVPLAHTFGYKTAEQIAELKERAGQQQRQAWLRNQRQNGRFGMPLTVFDGRIRTGYPEPTEPGLPALLKYLRGYWVQPKLQNATCDALDDRRIPLATFLAIRLDKAYEVWGYGTVVTAPLSAETQPASADWTGERLAKQHAVFVVAGHRDPTKRLAILSGLEETKIRRLISPFKSPKTDVGLNSVWSSPVNKKR